MQNEEKTYPLVMWGIAFFAIAITQFALWRAHSNPAISEAYLQVYYSDLGWIVLAISGIMFLYQIVERMGFSLSIMEFEEDNNPIDSIWIKLLVTFIFAGMMLLPLSSMHSTVLPIPHSINEGFSLNPVTSAVLNSWVPGLYEDLYYLFALPYLFFLILAVLVYLIFNLDIRESRVTYWTLRMVGILIGVLIFVSAHGGEDGVYGRDLQAYVSAFVFGIIQATLYALMGIYLPLAHIFHNAVVSLGFITALSIGGVPLMQTIFPLFLFKINQKILLRKSKKNPWLLGVLNGKY